jgi:hypothetical protein
MRAKQPPGVCAAVVIDIPDLPTARREYEAHRAIRPDHLASYLDPEKYPAWRAWSRQNDYLKTRLDMALQVERSRTRTIYLPEKATACEAEAIATHPMPAPKSRAKTTEKPC